MKDEGLLCYSEYYIRNNKSGKQKENMGKEVIHYKKIGSHCLLMLGARTGYSLFWAGLRHGIALPLPPADYSLPWTALNSTWHGQNM